MSGRDRTLYGRNAAVVVHAGAGNIDSALMPKSLERQYRQKLKAALQAGYKVVTAGGSALDAVIASVKVMENAPIFNAGKGSCMTYNGKIEMDAAVMVGDTLAAGAVAGITCVKNPILAARAVMELSPHLLLVGASANAFAKKVAGMAKLEIVPPEYFRTERAERNLKKFLVRKKTEDEPSVVSTGAPEGDENVPLRKNKGRLASGKLEAKEKVSSGKVSKKVKGTSGPARSGKYGTVGAVAVDRSGTVAVATSTGGTLAKAPGRVGDSPIIGAGTYADNDTVAASATGHGEHFIRSVIAHELSSLIRYRGMPVRQATETVIRQTLERTSGDGGIIALTPAGDYAICFNTRGMFRGVILQDGESFVEMFRLG